MEDIQKILAIETSGRHGSIAALVGEQAGCRLIEQITERGGERTAQALAPSLQHLLDVVAWTPMTVNLVAVAIGPGSFTGLRIGVTTAKAFAYASGANIAGVDTLEAIAAQAPTSQAPLWVVLDAQRQELFTAKYRTAHLGSSRALRETGIVSQPAWISMLRPGDRVTGPALGKLLELLPSNVEVVAQELWHPTAAAIGQLAWAAYQAGARDDLWKLAPKYYRASAAEEKNPA